MKYYDEIVDVICDIAALKKEMVTPDTNLYFNGLDELDMQKICIAMNNKYKLFVDFGHIELYDIIVDEFADSYITVGELCERTYPDESDIVTKVIYNFNNEVTDKRKEFKSIIESSSKGCDSAILENQLAEFDSRIIKERIKIDYQRIKKIGDNIKDRRFPDTNEQLDKCRNEFERYYNFLITSRRLANISPLTTASSHEKSKFENFEKQFVEISKQIERNQQALERKNLITTLSKLIISAIVAYIGYKLCGGLWWWVGGFAIFNGGWRVIVILCDAIIRVVAHLLSIVIIIAVIALVIAGVIFLLQ